MNLKNIRRSKGVSRYQLARMAGIKDSTLQSIENNDDPNPTFKTMCKIADALGITLDELRRN